MQVTSSIQVVNDTRTAKVTKYCCCARYGWLNFFSWTATLTGIAALITGAIYISRVGLSSGYSDATCTITISGGYLNRNDYCGKCDHCTCKICCDYFVMVTPLNSAPPFNGSMKKRACNSESRSRLVKIGMGGSENN